MKTVLVGLRNLVALFGMLLILSSCGGGSSNCPLCGTASNGQIGLIDVMYVPEHNPTGVPGGPFTVFDIGFVDPTNRLYSITDRLGVDVAVFNTISGQAVFPIGGDNTIAEDGNYASMCWNNSTSTVEATETVPPILSAQGNYTRFGCKTKSSTAPGFAFSVNGLGAHYHFGGFTGAQCCTNRGSVLNPLNGPNGLEVTADGNFMFVSNGSSQLFVFDLRPMLTSNYVDPPLLTASIPTGTTGDFDGPVGISACGISSQGRAFTDPTCGDLRADELGTTGTVVHFARDGKDHYLLGIINGDPGLPFFTVMDLTGVVTSSGTDTQQHCLPYNQGYPFSPGGPINTINGFPANYSSCVLGQIYYDGSAINDLSLLVDDASVDSAATPCPDPSLAFAANTINPVTGLNVATAGGGVPSGASGLNTGTTGNNTGTPAAGTPNIPCHHGPILVYDATKPQATGGQYVAGQNCTTSTCMGSVGVAGLGGLIFYPPTQTFLLANTNSTLDLTVSSVDVIDPLYPFPNGSGGTTYGPAVINSFPIYNCMPAGLSLGPGTDVLVSCQDHDGRAFAPNAVIMNGTTGEVLANINNIGYTDQTWYNPGDNNYYLASGGFPTGPVLGVINAGTRTWLQNVPTQGNAHSVAADPISNRIFVPLGPGALCQSQSAIGCIGVFASQ
jgi:hypothetical protein